jgi:hypothetical protein
MTSTRRNVDRGRMDDDNYDKDTQMIVSLLLRSVFGMTRRKRWRRRRRSVCIFELF